MGSIYKITNTVNGKSYIGQTRHDAMKTRIRDHFAGYGNRIVKRSIEKYGEDVFIFEILHDGIIPELLDSYEIEAIAKYNALVPNGYNLTTGGGSGSRSEESRRKISESKKGENHPLYGKTHSDETKRKMSENNAMKRPEVRRKNSETQKGRTLSDETKRKISENNPMKRPEVRQKVSETNTGKTHSDETKRKISEAKIHPLHQVVHQFFLSLPESLSKREKNKRLYDKFPNIHQSSIRQWTRKWRSERTIHQVVLLTHGEHTPNA